MKYDFYITGTIGEEFDWWTGQRGTTSDMVAEFLNKHKDKEVNIAVSSPGGYLDEGITIAEMIAAHGKCNMVVIGMTASAATVLCMKAKSVKIARGSLMLIHNSSQYIFGQGLSNKRRLDAYIENLKKTRENLDTIDKAIADFYAYRNGKTVEENMARMDEEKWMTAKDAVDFGIVDGILEDDETANQAKAIQNVYATYNGIEEHYCLPALPDFEKPAAKVPKGIMARLKEFVNGFKGVVEEAESQEEEETVNDNSLNTDNHINFDEQMRKIVLNLVCALLCVQDIAVDENGYASLTEDQLNALEKGLKEKDDRIAALEKSLKKAADTETALTALQEEFENFKAEAGADTALKPSSEGSKNEPANAKNLYNSIKKLI